LTRSSREHGGARFAFARVGAAVAFAAVCALAGASCHDFSIFEHLDAHAPSTDLAGADLAGADFAGADFASTDLAGPPPFDFSGGLDSFVPSCSGGGCIVFAVTYYPATTGAVALAAADLDKDGKNDLAILCRGSNDVRRLYNQPSATGTFGVQPALSLSSLGTNATSIAAGDVTSDGWSDLLVGMEMGFASTVAVFVNDQTGTFTSKPAWSWTDPAQSVTIGALNINGSPWHAVVGMTGKPAVFHAGYDGNVGMFTMASAGGTLAPPVPNGIVVAEVNSALPVDVLAAVSGPSAATDGGVYSAVSVVLNGAPVGGLARYVDYPLSYVPVGLAAIDFNGDATIDYVVVGGANYTIGIGNGNGTFTLSPTSLVGIDFVSVAVGDFDGGSGPDIMLADRVGNQIVPLIGNGNGAFTIGVPIPLGATPKQVIAADLDQRGHTDLAVVLNNDTVAVLLNATP
jgi:FG-GAP-like repeat/Pentapeptide repeats (8 copies)